MVSAQFMTIINILREIQENACVDYKLTIQTLNYRHPITIFVSKDYLR